MMWGYGWGGWILGMLMMVLFLGGLIALAFFALRGRSRGGATHRDPDARDILDERYARGELSREEYEERKRVLGGKAA
ncbi:MAG TPA: SHOCT domain-containing protein [Actinomycetota bacterium]